MMRMSKGERTDILIIKSLVQFKTLALRNKLLAYTVMEFTPDEERNVESKMINIHSHFSDRNSNKRERENY